MKYTVVLAGAAALSNLSFKELLAGQGQFVSKRPAPADRKFVSPAIDAEIEVTIKATKMDEELAWLFENCLPNTLDTTVKHVGVINGKEDSFIITGDIDAMWLRDSAAQVSTYVPYIQQDSKLKLLIKGVINRHARSVLIDPYANAFNYDNTKRSEWYGDDTDMKMELHERKWEVDSLCYVIRLAHQYWKACGDTELFDEEWQRAMDLITRTFRQQQRKLNKGPYRFQRHMSRTDNLSNGGYGPAMKPTGMICSMFRPSDDATVYPFLIPSNLMAVAALKQLAEIAHAIKNEDLALECIDIANEVHEAVMKHGVVEHPVHGKVFAYEVDGLGHSLVIDEPNLPNLLSLPYFGAVERTDPIYVNTRAMILSASNKYFIKGKYAEGVGSDHTPKGYVWHLSLIARALTSTDDKEKVQCLKMLKATHNGTGFMHEGFDANNPARYTRKWFAWANTLFGELILKTAKEKPNLLRIV
jgi:meiotically up-regulated gene 157 (Mug157) protein